MSFIIAYLGHSAADVSGRPVSGQFPDCPQCAGYPNEVPIGPIHGVSFLFLVAMVLEDTPESRGQP
jgi:hypothetical protein